MDSEPGKISTNELYYYSMMLRRLILRLCIRLGVIGLAFVAAQFISGPAWVINCLVPGFVFVVVATIGVTLINLLIELDSPGRARRN